MKTDNPLSQEDLKEFKSLVEVANQERKNLQLLVEYMGKNSDQFEERKLFFEKLNIQIPDTLKKLDSLDRNREEIKNFDVRLRDFQRLSKEMESNYSNVKRQLDALHMLAEHVEVKTGSLDQQRTLVEKANEDAGRLNVLIWDMDSKIKKLQDENKYIKITDRNINRLETMLDKVSDQVDAVNMFPGGDEGKREKDR